MSNLNERLKGGISKEELQGILEALPTGCDLRISRNMLFVSYDGQIKSIDIAAIGLPQQIYEIWAEDCAGSGAGATRLGSASGRTFREAVMAYFRDHPSTSFNAENLTERSCKLYSSGDAHASCG